MQTLLALRILHRVLSYPQLYELKNLVSFCGGFSMPEIKHRDEVEDEIVSFELMI